MCVVCVVLFKQKTAYEMRISDWSSDVCSSDLDKPDAENTNDCIIPPEVPKTELRNLVSEQSEHEVREIVDYIEWQCNKKREHELEETGNTELVEDRKSTRLNSSH